MTITAKRMFAAALAVGVLGIGTAFARDDYNTVLYQESFQDLTAWGGVNTNINITNGWYSTTDDLSAFTNLTYTFTACTFPITTYDHATGNRVLKLATEGATLTNSFIKNNDGNWRNGFDMSTNKTYLDTMVQFVASEDKPASLLLGNGPADDTGIKTAVYADVNTNLMIYCGTYTTSGTLVSNAVVNSGITLDATQWYRLTIVYDATYYNENFLLPFQYFPVFRVLLNGVPVTNSNGYAFDDNWKTDTINGGVLPTLTSSSVGTWFPAATAGGAYFTLTAVAFQGTGYIDDLVVTCAQPSYVSQLGVHYLTVVCGANGSNSVGTATYSQVEVANGANTQVVYTANDWHRIQTLLQDGAPVSGAANLKIYTQTLNNVTAAISNNVTFFMYSDAGNYDAGYTNVPTTWLSQYAPEGTSLHNNSPLTLHQQYLLNVNPFLAETNNFRVTSITATGSTVHVGVALGINSSPWSAINGTLNLYWLSSLSGASNLIGSASLSSGTATFNDSGVGGVSNRFYRAVIE